MSCSVCLQANQSARGLYNDCIIEFLEKIKAHYLHLKAQYDDRHRQVEKLQLANEELKTNLAALKLSPKRRKTSSFEESPTVSEKSTNDCLNEAIKAEPSWDESFFVGTQQRLDTPKNILKVSNRSPERSISPSSNALRPSPGGGLLPKRLKSTPLTSRQKEISRTPTGTENRSPKWTSKEDIKADKVRLIKRDWNLSFIQPPVTQKASSGVPQMDTGGFKSPSKNILSLKKEAKLKQSRLKFDTSKAKEENDETVIPETDETFAGEMIAASPTSATISGFESTKAKLKTNRKLNRHRLNATCETIKKKAPSQLDIKIEPQSTVKKNIDFDEKHGRTSKPIAKATPSPPSVTKSRIKSDNNVSNISGIGPHSDSSVCILPSQSNDVIIVEDSHAETNVDIDSAALFDEMMIKADETSDFLKEIEQKCISSIKQKQDKQNAIARTLSVDFSSSSSSKSKDMSLSAISKTNEQEHIKPKKVEQDTQKALTSTQKAKSKNELTKPTVKSAPQWNCKECESFYSIAGRNMPENELVKRVKHCQENHRRTICGTPEGFWNPCFPPTQDDDSANETFVDPQQTIEQKIKKK